MIEDTTLDRPARVDNPDGETRCIGVEVEFAGVEPEAAATLVADEFGGTPQRVSSFEYDVCDTEFGDFRVEIDMMALRKLGQEVETDEDGSLLKSTARLLGKLSETAVPREIITPPIPWNELGRVNRLIERLAEAGAEGTQESMLFAFGVHLNPDCASFEPAYFLRVLQSFCCLHDWLAQTDDVDMIRRITPFIQPYPADYEQHILDPDYGPDLAGLIDDYLEFNASRNRALDMLPVFCFLDRERVRAKLPEEKINPRPTFHYRLPNSEIGRERWGIGNAWNGWVKVERLAENTALLADLAERRLDYLDRINLLGADRWVRTVEDQCLASL